MQAPSAKETITTTKDGPSQSIPAETPGPANEKVAPCSLPDEAFPVVRLVIFVPYFKFGYHQFFECKFNFESLHKSLH